MAPDSCELASSATARPGVERAANGLAGVYSEADVGLATTDIARGGDAQMPIKTDLPSPTMHASTTASWDSTQTDSAATSSPVTAAALQVQSVRLTPMKAEQGWWCRQWARSPFRSQTPYNGCRRYHRSSSLRLASRTSSSAGEKMGRCGCWVAGASAQVICGHPMTCALSPWTCVNHPALGSQQAVVRCSVQSRQRRGDGSCQGLRRAP